MATSTEERRTFAIISHPDAGKTTITEQLLMYGGVIRKAGTVKGKKSGQFAKSDWMEIEKQRGISVTSSVLQFDYNDTRINILDTPGHEDFSEDTYRTLMAVDSAVMVIDSAKGIEPQTEKLFKVCRMRGIPIFTFINKLDREGLEPLDLLAQIEEILNIETVPLNWPVGMGKNFRGIIDIKNHEFIPANKNEENVESIPLDEDFLSGTSLDEDNLFQQAVDEVQLQSEAGYEYDETKINSGDQTPIFFGSALSNFGVQNFLDYFVKLAPKPGPHVTVDDQVIQPTNPEFSGFIFKIQANMNPAHRDRIAFVRICSGEFDRGMNVKLARNEKQIRLNNSTEFMAEDRQNVEMAVSGDIIGLYDTGNFQIGDTIYSGKQKITYPKLPEFTPEMFMKVTPKNVMKQKSFHKGMKQLVQEGAVQLYQSVTTNEYILGAVGQLQFEVFKFRMENEYNSEVIMEPMGNKIARWIDEDVNVDHKMTTSRNLLVKDVYGKPLFLFENKFAMRWFEDKYPNIKLIEKL